MRNLSAVLLAPMLFAGVIALGCNKTDDTADSGAVSDTDTSTAGDVAGDGPQVFWDGLGDRDEGAVVVKECSADSDCVTLKGEEGWACDCEGNCIAVLPFAENGCYTNANCGWKNGIEYICDPCTKTCKQALSACEPCTMDNECSGYMDGQYSTRCVDRVIYAGIETTLTEKVCAPWCPLSTGVCTVEGAPTGTYVCGALVDGDGANGACVPLTMDCGNTPTECTTDDDCEDGEKCWPDRNICGCRDGLSCDFGEACHPDTHQCVPGCTSDTECGDGKVCAQSLCSDPCSGSYEKGTVQGCNDPIPIEGDYHWDCVDGHCEVPGMCFSATDCRLPETYCDATTKTCLSGCLIDFDCKQSSKMCNELGECVAKPCTGNYWCSCGEVCNMESKECETAEGLYCAVCNQEDSETCSDGVTMCIGLQDPDTNEDLGDFCFPACLGKKGDDNRCPQGWQCKEIQEQNGATKELCYRDCSKKVVGGCAMGDAPDPIADPGPELAGEDVATTSDP